MTCGLKHTVLRRLILKYYAKVDQNSQLVGQIDELKSRVEALTRRALALVANVVQHRVVCFPNLHDCLSLAGIGGAIDVSFCELWYRHMFHVQMRAWCAGSTVGGFVLIAIDTMHDGDIVRRIERMIGPACGGAAIHACPGCVMYQRGARGGPPVS